MERIIAERFVVERLVGTGGMGEVFRARDRATGGLAAVKVLHGTLARDVERFQQEVQLLADISHPRIVRYVAHGVIDGGRPWLAMEWLEGEDLGERLEKRGLTLHETLALATRIAEGLAALHDRGIVHRDIKPSNVFIPEGDLDRAKLLDLGVARILQNTRPSTRTGIMVGTPGYMAPEQARGSKDVDPRADVFALGCVLYECLAGRPAFVGENVAALLAKIIVESPPPLREIGITVPAELDALVGRMLAKVPAVRPGSGAAVVRELEAFARVADAPAQRASVPQMRALTGGERRLVCIVMAAFDPTGEDDDAAPLSSNTTLTAAVDPRALVASFGAEAEHLADGSILVTLATGGTPTSRGGAGDQAAHAARCALALRSHLVDASVVLATGLANLSGDDKVGDVIERAAALLASSRARQQTIEHETLHGQRAVFLDETTAGLLDLRFDLGGDERGLFLRGLRERDANARTLLGKPTPFVGRDRELGTLLAIYDECIGEPVARAVLVTGFPGAGKSRLTTELVRRLREEPPAGTPAAELWYARGDVMSDGAPFALVARLLRRAAGITGGEATNVRFQKLRARVARNLSEADVPRVTDFLAEIASIASGERESVQLRAARQDPILMGDQMRRAFCDLVAAEAAAGPLVIVIEDLHWGDRPSVSLLDAALRAAADRSLMVLAAARGEVHDAFPHLWEQRSLQEVRLGPLGRRAGEQLVRDVLGSDLAAAEVARLLDRAAGNVFYLEELIRSYAEGTGRAPRSVAPPAPGTVPPPLASSTFADPSWTLPATVLAMVEARLQRLDPMARRVLRAASVFGERFWRGGVLELLGGKFRESDVDDWLAELAQREIVARRDGSRFPLDREYAFRHAIVRDAAYQMLTPDDQALGHRLAAEWLERVGEEEPMLLGEHFERGGSHGRAAVFYTRAAFLALDGNDFVAAKVRAGRAIDAGASGADHGRLQLLLAEASRWSGEHAAARDHARQAMVDLPDASDEWCFAAAELVDAAITIGQVEEAHAAAKRVLAAAPAEISAAHAVATSRIAVALGVVGLAEPVAALLAPLDAPTAAPAVGNDLGARAFFLAAKVARASWEGDLEHAALFARESASCFDLIGDARNAARQRLSAGWALGELGVYSIAESMLEEARGAAERLGVPTLAHDAKLRLGNIYTRTNRPRDGIAATQEVIAAFALQRDRIGEGRARAYLAGVHYFASDHAAAAEEALRAVPLLEHSPPYRAALLGFYTLTLIHVGAPAEDVKRAGAEAMRLYEALGGATEGEALIRVAYAEALHYAGDVEGTKKAIAGARDRLLARAAKIDNAEYKRAFLGAVREHVRTLARAGEWLT